MEPRRLGSDTEIVMGDPGPCPACETVQLERRGGKDVCPRCFYIQPCCDGGEATGSCGSIEAGRSGTNR